LPPLDARLLIFADAIADATFSSRWLSFDADIFAAFAFRSLHAFAASCLSYASAAQDAAISMPDCRHDTLFSLRCCYAVYLPMMISAAAAISRFHLADARFAMPDFRRLRHFIPHSIISTLYAATPPPTAFSLRRISFHGFHCPMITPFLGFSRWLPPYA